MMKTTTHKKKMRARAKWLAAGISLLVFGQSLSAQTVTCTTLHQPCASDGELWVHTTGFTFPLTIYYYDYNGIPITHAGLTSADDTLHHVANVISYVAVEDATGSYAGSSTDMVQPFSVDPVSTTDAICPSLTGIAQVTINGGTAPASVQWFSDALGVRTFVAAGNPVSLPPGDYFPLITDGAGCTAIGHDSVSLIHINNISGISVSTATTPANCTNGTATVTGVSGGTAPYSYLWSNGATSASVSGLTMGNYSVTVIDAQGCNEMYYATVGQSIIINPNTVSTNATCLQNDGSITSFPSGGSPPYTYLYSNGVTTPTASGLYGDTYISLTVTDANGCTGNTGRYIGTSTPVHVTYTSTASSCTSPTGSITLNITGGVAPYTISWPGHASLGGSSLSSIAVGSYFFYVTDANGCVAAGSVVVPPVSVISAGLSVTNPLCPATTGSISAIVTGSNPPFSYLWSNGATTATNSGVNPGYYSCTITDNVGCSVHTGGGVTTITPVHIALSSMEASCRYSADGSAFAMPSGGTAPYSYLWSNGQTTATAIGLAPGGYNVRITDANGCAANNYASVPYDLAGNSCYCTISGKVYNDMNGNCVYDSGEPGVEHIMIHCDPYGYTFTDANGDYSFQVINGNYTISEVVQYQYPLAACQANNIPVTVIASSGCVNTVNFANSIVVLHDLHISRVSLTQAIPGNNYTQKVIVQNDGTVSEPTIQLGYSNDGQLPLTGTSTPVYTQPSPVAEPNWYEATSGLPTLTPGAAFSFLSQYTVSPMIPLGTDIYFYDTVSSAAPLSTWTSDYTPWNNVQALQIRTQSSYDPNFKEVSPQGSGPQGFISTSDSVLDYTVHFQNTGTYYAQKIVVVDTLDSDLDISSLHVGYSDHNYTATVSESGVLTFTFDNIHLDWQAQNDLTSRGMVMYSIRQKPHLAAGTEITNSAAIYFDYNAPVITNQTLNTINMAAGIAEKTANSQVHLYPNPATDELNIDAGTEAISMITICDLQGRVVRAEKVNNSGVQKIAVGNLVEGLYFIELQRRDGQKLTTRFVKD